ncbi:hypothetical protein FDECE_3096 [Fusarium decemcellulare]|nr:hypothetical protein FDECE_3096 [Fusarium decemcellulare]
MRKVKHAWNRLRSCSRGRKSSPEAEFDDGLNQAAQPRNDREQAMMSNLAVATEPTIEPQSQKHESSIVPLAVDPATQSDIVAGPISQPPDPKLQETPLPQDAQASPTLTLGSAPSLEDESAKLWKRAYDLVYEENPEIMDDVEAVLKEDARIPQEANMRDRLADVAVTQKEKFQNRQWKLQWHGKSQPVRDKIESIVELANQWSSLISLGMTHAPPYVSVPWSATTALLPMMMNEFKEHQSAIDGLESTAKLILSYQLAERVFLVQGEATRKDYTNAVIDLYKKVLEYQATAIQYFGRSTLKRLRRNLMGSTVWADMPGTIAKLDDNARRSLNFQAMRDQAAGLSSLEEILKRQEEQIETLISTAIANTDEVGKIVNWVSDIPVEKDHADVREKLGEGHFKSGQWFFDDSQVTAWMNWDQGSRTLWLRGGMGTGKSSLTSILIEELVQNADGITAMFYCSKKVDEMTKKRNKVNNILRSLLGQSVASIDGSSVYDGVKKRYNRRFTWTKGSFALTFEDCITFLQEMATKQPSTHFTMLIDALDECEDYDELLSRLSPLSASENVRFFFSSRLEVNVKSAFKCANEITILSQNRGDIKRYLDIEIPRRRDGCGITDLQVEKLREILLSRANGMFLWTKIQVDHFLHRIKSKRIRVEADIAQRLKDLEQFEARGEELLYAAYDDEYNRATAFGEEPSRLAAVVSALRWVLSAFRPLTLRELAYAISVNHSNRSPTSGIHEGDLLEFCSNLLIKDNSGIMQLAHLSVRHYLESRQSAEFTLEEVHKEAALTSLYFMLSPSYRSLALEGENVVQEGQVALTKEFRDYVTTYWSEHCRKVPTDEKVKEMMDALEEHRQKILQKTNSEGTAKDGDNIAVLESREALPDKGIVHGGFGRLSDFSELGLSEAEKLIAHQADLSAVDGFGDTALHYMAKIHNGRVMELLLRSKAPPNAQNNIGNTPLHITAMYGFGEGVRQLILNGADRNSRNHRGETALHLSLIHGHSVVFEMLLSAGVDALAQDHQESTPFHYAAQRESMDAVNLLLEEGYSPDGINDAGDTALSIAIKGENKRMIEALVRYGAIVRHKDNKLAASRGLKELVTGTPIDLQPRLTTARFTVADTAAEIVPDGRWTCQYCNVGRWLSSRRGVPNPHWPSFQELRVSAADCYLCEFFEKQIVQHNHGAINGPAGRLLVTIELASDRSWEKSAKDNLSLSLGGIVTLTWEICFDGLGDCETVTSDAPLLADTPTVYLRRDNMHILSKEISLDLLPATVADALSIVRSCGLHYVWVDALCIIQDDDRDYHREIPRLPSYYQNAAFVLAAASSKNDSQGLLRERAPPLQDLGTFRFLPRPYPAVNNPTATAVCTIHLRKPVKSAIETFEDTMLKRGWLLQEIILPRRLLIWGEDQVYWTCRACFRSEGSTIIGDPTWVNYLPPPSGAPASPNGISRSYLTWYSLVELYSRASYTFDGDRLRAIEEMAREFIEKSQLSKYVAGLWTDNITNGLLWYVVRLGGSERLINPGPPSWSWASVGSSVTFCLLRGVRPDVINDDSHRLSYVESSVNIDTGGTMKLDAMILVGIEDIAKAAHQQKYQLECEYFFDCVEYEKRFRDGGGTTGGRHMLMFVGPWCAGSLNSEATPKMRCIGLVLFDSGLGFGHDAALTRVGLFLGLRYDGRLDRWTRQTIVMS